MTDRLKNIVLPHCELVILEEGILQLNLSDISYEIDHLDEIHEATKLLCRGEKILQLINTTPYSSVSTEARRKMGGPKYTAYSRAEAFVIHSLAQRILGNYYLKFDRPVVPTKLFTDYNKAMAWLKNQK